MWLLFYFVVPDSGIQHGTVCDFAIPGPDTPQTAYRCRHHHHNRRRRDQLLPVRSRAFRHNTPLLDPSSSFLSELFVMSASMSTPIRASQFELSEENTVQLEHPELEQSPPSSSSSPSTASDSMMYKSLLVFAGFMAMFQIIGINTSFGVFQQFY